MAKPIVMRMIDQKQTAVAGGELLLNTQGLADDNFVVRKLRVKMAFAFSAGAAAVGVADIGTTSFFWRWRKTGMPMLNNVSALALDLWRRRLAKQKNVDLFALADQTNTGADTAYFVFDVPFYRAAQPVGQGDYEQPVSEVGDCKIRIPNSFNGNTLASCTVTIYAVGYEDDSGKYRAGSQFQIQDLTNDGSNQPPIPVGGKLRELFEYAVNTATSTLQSELLNSFKLDNRVIIEGANIAVSELTDALVCDDEGGYYAYSDFYGLNTVGAARVATLYAGGTEDSLADLPVVQIAVPMYASRGASAGSNYRYCVETVYPNAGTELANRIPGARTMEAGDVAQAVRRVGAEGQAVPAGAIPAPIATYAPAVVASR